MKDIDVVHVEAAQRTVDFVHNDGWICCVSAKNGLCRNDQLAAIVVAGGAADDLLSAVVLGGVDEVHAEINCCAHDADALIDRRTAAETDTAVAAATQSGHARVKTGVSKPGTVH